MSEQTKLQVELKQKAFEQKLNELRKDRQVVIRRRKPRNGGIYVRKNRKGIVTSYVIKFFRDNTWQHEYIPCFVRCDNGRLQPVCRANLFKQAKRCGLSENIITKCLDNIDIPS